jgi:hypothetical protein
MKAQKFQLDISKFVKDNRSLFEKIMTMPIEKTEPVGYTILNYKTILVHMEAFLLEYLKYREEGTNKHGDRIISRTKALFDMMFEPDSKTYRMDFGLTEMPRINREFLEGSDTMKKCLQRIIDDEVEYMDAEMQAVVLMTSNQYKKLSQVFKDDLLIWCWLTTGRGANLPESARRAYHNPNDPVIHKKGKKKK